MESQRTQPVDIDLKPSGWLAAVLGLIALTASAIVWQLSLQWALRYALLTGVIGSTSYFIARDALLLLNNSWQRLQINTQGKLELINRQGERFQPKLAGDTFVHPYLTILHIKEIRNKSSWRLISYFLKRNVLHFGLPPLILLAGQADRQQLRRLHVWLLWGRCHEYVVEDDGLLA